jgi:hypothetical protein
MKSRRLYRARHGETLVSLWIEELADGGLRFIGQDISPALKEQYGDSDYEYWVDIAAADLPRLVQALIADMPRGWRRLDRMPAIKLVERRFAGNPDGFASFRALCAAAGIAAPFGFWH